MRILLFILGVLALLSITPPGRSSYFNAACPPRRHACRMKCNTNEYAVRYCDDSRICCRMKNVENKKNNKW
uniref:Beta-defensin n=1 Tax=Prolemur simus TaxID=1328070 RepID=A0A8C8ZCH3_PROSS